MRHGKHVSAVPACFGTRGGRATTDIVNRYGLTYMLAETSYYQQATIPPENLPRGRLGDLFFYCESHYDHPGVDGMGSVEGGGPGDMGWLMHYPTHCTSHLVSVTGERLVEVNATARGNDHPTLKDNFYNNPFWAEMAMFKTNRGHGFRVRIAWHGAMRLRTGRVDRRADEFLYGHPNGLGPVICAPASRWARTAPGSQARPASSNTSRSSGTDRHAARTDAPPSGHEGSHAFGQRVH